MERFDVHITFSNGDTFAERGKDIEATKSAIVRLTRGPAAMGGLIKEFRVVDSFDLTVFHVVDGETLFPPPPSRS